jgi:hypothetical protein
VARRRVCTERANMGKLRVGLGQVLCFSAFLLTSPPGPLLREQQHFGWPPTFPTRPFLRLRVLRCFTMEAFKKDRHRGKTRAREAEVRVQGGWATMMDKKGTSKERGRSLALSGWSTSAEQAPSPLLFNSGGVQPAGDHFPKQRCTSEEPMPGQQQHDSLTDKKNPCLVDNSTTLSPTWSTVRDGKSASLPLISRFPALSQDPEMEEEMIKCACNFLFPFLFLDSVALFLSRRRPSTTGAPY